MHLMGRQAVLEALRSEWVTSERVSVASTARGDGVDEIKQLANERGVPVEQVSEKRIDTLAGGDRMHQGVVVSIEPPRPLSLEAFVDTRQGRDWSTNLLLLDHVHNPSNVGMILRTAAAAGIDAVVLPRQGTAGIGPLTVKAGSGMVFAVPLIDVATTADAIDGLSEAYFSLVGLDAGHDSLFTAALPDRAAYILGNETVGLSVEAAERLDARVSLPLHNGVESLNVAATAAVLAYELVRRR